MARNILTKELDNTRLLKDYASWIYCDSCNKTVGYLCYTYHNHFKFEFHCNCGNTGNLNLILDETEPYTNSNNSLMLNGNRLCCPTDSSPLLSINHKNIRSIDFSIGCTRCKKIYSFKENKT